MKNSFNHTDSDTYFINLKDTIGNTVSIRDSFQYVLKEFILDKCEQRLALKNIVLDFEGVELISRAVAHEIVEKTVYCNDVKKINIIYSNVNAHICKFLEIVKNEAPKDKSLNNSLARYEFSDSFRFNEYLTTID